MKKRERSGNAFLGYLGFFVMTAITVTAAVLIYGAVSEAVEDRAIIAVVMLAVVCGLALLCTLIDMVRRRLLVDRRVRRILDATDRITSGDLSARVSPAHEYGKYDVFDRIGENLDRMASELSRTEMLRDDFVANVSHEIKTPLSVIRNTAEALSGGDLTDAERTEHLQTLMTVTGRLTRLVTDILRLNKLENREIFPEKRRVELGESVRRAVLGYMTAMEEKDIELDCDGIKDVAVSSDEDMLAPVWSNLLSNAVKFTPRGGKITVRVGEENGKAVVSVRDTGCGMSPEVGEHIFEKFYQGDSSHSGEGNGLGLALVKRVIDILGGRITVRSVPGDGSEFIVEVGDVLR